LQAVEDLWAHVDWATDESLEDALLGLLALVELSETEVSDLVEVVFDQNIRRFEIAMDDTPLVQEFITVGDLPCDL
jgi:hypothetical protein